MPKIYLDSSILVAYQITNHPFHDQAFSLLRQLHSQQHPFCLSPLAVDEYLYALTKYLNTGYLSSEKDIQTSLKKLSQLNPEYSNLNWNKVSLLQSYQLIQKYHLRPRDAFHLLTMNHNNISYLATLDSDFNPLFKQKIIKSATTLTPA